MAACATCNSRRKNVEDMACLPLLEQWLCSNIQGNIRENGNAEEAQAFVLPTGETEQKAELRTAHTNRELGAAARMNGGTAAGWDGIPMSLVKAAGEQTRQTIRDVLKQIMVIAEISESWKDSRVILLYKGSGDKRDLKNYRPIAVTPVLYRMFAQVVRTRLQN